MTPTHPRSLGARIDRSPMGTGQLPLTASAWRNTRLEALVDNAYDASEFRPWTSPGSGVHRDQHRVAQSATLVAPLILLQEGGGDTYPAPCRAQPGLLNDTSQRRPTADAGDGANHPDAQHAGHERKQNSAMSAASSAR